MKIVIHGATNLSNFGDILFAHLFYDYLTSFKGIQVDFLDFPRYGIGSFCRKELNYYRKLRLKGILEADVYVMMSGGYLGDDMTSFKENIKRYIRYLLPAIIFQILNKPVYVMGVGGGPLSSKLLRKTTVKILNKAAVINVRDEETKKYFLEYGVKNNILVTADTALTITSSMVPPLNIKTDVRYVLDNYKVLFLHLVAVESADKTMADTIIPAVNRFMIEHQEYGIILCLDGLSQGKAIENYESYKRLNCNNKVVYNYSDVWQLCSLLSKVDFVITMKLHVGIVSSALSKSVISFPLHLEKVERFYRQIGEKDRSIHIRDLTEDIAYNMICKYFDKPIIISDELRSKAKTNLTSIMIDK